MGNLTPLRSATERAALPVALDRVLLISLVVLVAASTARYLARHTLVDGGWQVIWVAVALLGAQLALLRARAASGPGSPARVTSVLVVATACATLVWLAPSFAWCVVPVAFAVLGELAVGPAVLVTCGLAATVSAAWSQITGGVDPTLIVGPTVLVFIIVAAVRALRSQDAERARLAADLVATHEDLAREQRRSGALDERNRLARDLHDSVGQSLASIGLILETASRDLERDPSSVPSRVAQASQAARVALTEVRAVVADLADCNEPAAQRLVAGLDKTMDDLPERLIGAVHIHGDVRRIDPVTTDALLLSARGAVANVIEHSDAGRVSVSLTVLDEEVLLDVLDDGRGFVAGYTARGWPRGHGLRGLHERASRLGGTLTVETGPGAGTTVSMALPLPAAKETE